MCADKALQKYFTHYAEPEAAWLEDFPARFARVVVVPFYRESPEALQRFIAFIEVRQNSLLVLVSNRPDSDNTTQWHNDLSAVFSTDPSWQNADGRLSLFSCRYHSAVLLVDRVLKGPPIPAKQGVGLARKIGADIACRLIDRGCVQSPWIANSDADALLPANYFQPQSTSVPAAALVYPYRHIFLDDLPPLPTRLYEFSLHHYVEGLRWAHSPYAFHTLGSIIAVHYRHYAQVRGFPKRAGAEDFYLLNKLAKTGAIVSLTTPSIAIAARLSDRVPFGTGPATLRLAQQQAWLEMPLYHPAGFVYLQAFHTLLQALADTPRQNYVPLLRGIVASHFSTLDADQLLECCKFLQLTQAVAHIARQGQDAAGRLRHLRAWFDGFKTLKLIHWLRDNALGTIAFHDWPRHSAHWWQCDNETLKKQHSEILLLAQHQPRGNNGRISTTVDRYRDNTYEPIS